MTAQYRLGRDASLRTVPFVTIPKRCEPLHGAQGVPCRHCRNRSPLLRAQLCPFRNHSYWTRGISCFFLIIVRCTIVVSVLLYSRSFRRNFLPEASSFFMQARN